MSTAPTRPPPVAASFVGSPAPTLAIVRGIAGAAVGGALGYFLFRWLAQRGLFAHAVPGALVGLGAGLAAFRRSQILGIICAISAAILIVVAEWLRAPMLKDDGLLYFVLHLHQMNNAGVKLCMMGFGAACAYWFGQ